MLANAGTMLRKRPSDSQSREVDTKINDVVQVIVHDFGGDTMAFFKSIRSKKAPQKAASDENEAKVVSCFAKNARPA